MLCSNRLALAGAAICAAMLVLACGAAKNAVRDINEPGLTPPRRLVGAPPSYPEEAKRVNLEGIVRLEIIVDRAGRVADVKVVQGAPLGMTEAAVAAVKGWTYVPARRKKRAVAVRLPVTVRFRLSQDSQ